MAFAILALTVAAAMPALSGGLRILSVSDAHAEAVRLAESRLAESVRTAPLVPSVQSGEQGRYHWRVEIAPYDGAAPGTGTVPSAYVVTVFVTWGGKRSVTLSTVELGASGNG